MFEYFGLQFLGLIKLANLSSNLIVTLYSLTHVIESDLSLVGYILLSVMISLL